jgi:hypothetical protein
MKCYPVRKSCNAVSSEHRFACLFELLLVCYECVCCLHCFFWFVGIPEMFEIDIFLYECILCPDAFDRVYARYDPGYVLLREVRSGRLYRVSVCFSVNISVFCSAGTGAILEEYIYDEETGTASSQIVVRDRVSI